MGKAQESMFQSRDQMTEELDESGEKVQHVVPSLDGRSKPTKGLYTRCDLEQVLYGWDLCLGQLYIPLVHSHNDLAADVAGNSLLGTKVKQGL